MIKHIFISSCTLINVVITLFILHCRSDCYFLILYLHLYTFLLDKKNLTKLCLALLLTYLPTKWLGKVIMSAWPLKCNTPATAKASFLKLLCFPRQHSGADIYETAGALWWHPRSSGDIWVYLYHNNRHRSVSETITGIWRHKDILSLS